MTTATTGAWPSPTSTAAAGSGSKKVIGGPFRRPPENGCFAREMPQGAGVHALWGQRWTRLPFCLFSQTREVMSERGHGPRPQHGGGHASSDQTSRQGFATGIVAPFGEPLAQFEGERPGSTINLSWGHRSAHLPSADYPSRVPGSTSNGKESDVAGKKRPKSLAQTAKKAPAKPKRPKKTSRGK